MTVLEPGPGMGFFTLELARIVGPEGRVVAVDVQPKMVEGLQKRARRAGLSGYRFPPEMIHQAIWLYLRFTLSLRDVEDLLAERGVAVCYETPGQ